MKKILLVSLVAISLAACTTTERTVSGAAAGAAVGAAVGGGWRGAGIGALIGGLGTFIAITANGYCQYRQPDGRVITARCHWLR